MTEARTEDPPADTDDSSPEPPGADHDADLTDGSAGEAPVEAGGDDGGRLARWWRRQAARPTHELLASIITVLIVGTCVLLALFVLGPSNVLSDTTPAGGDMGAHVWGPAFLRDHVLDKLRLTGWTMDWYAGFPAYHFYMIVPSLVIAALSWVIPYGVAFKLVAVSGIVSFPVACWFLGRSARAPFPVPALLAVGGTLFLFDRSFSIYGGNIASTMAGEFAFSISLTIGVFYLGVLVRGFDTGRRRGLCALLLALTGLCHLLPFLFVLACTLIYLAVRPGVGRIVYLVTMGPVAALVTAFWLLPFLGRSGYMNDMGWERITSDRWVNYLWSRERLDPQLVNHPELRWVIVAAAVGLMLSLYFRRRLGLFLALVALASALAFMFVPQGRVWNARMLPFYYLALYLLAAVGVAEVIRLVASLLARDVERPVRWILATGPVVATAGVLVLLLLSLFALPGGSVELDGSYHWGPLSASNRSFVDSWAAWNFEGYEGLTESSSGAPQYRKSYPEYHDLVQTMAGIGRDRGCGRAMWEHEDAHDRYGTPMALMLLPFWTDGCIGSMEGLYFEASSTTPYHFLNQDELSWAPSNAQRELPYDPGSPSQMDFDTGVRHLQMMGVRYYLAVNPNTQALADASTSLTKLGGSGPWRVYEVADAPLVEGLANEPAVLTGQPTTGRPWQDTAVCWWTNPSDWDVVLTADGPPGWPRVARTVESPAGATPAQQCQPAANWGWFDGAGGPPTTPLEPVTVSNVVTTDDSVSFDVDRPGVPVLVKVSYFPNWQATGADGPYRATPNFMVVVPTDTHVELHYGYTPLDVAALALTVVGLAGLVVLARWGAVTVAAPTRFWGRAERPDLYPPPARPEPAPPVDEADPPVNPILEWFDQFEPLPEERAGASDEAGDEAGESGEPGEAATPGPGTHDGPAGTLRPDADEPPDQ